MLQSEGISTLNYSVFIGSWLKAHSSVVEFELNETIENKQWYVPLSWSFTKPKPRAKLMYSKSVNSSMKDSTVSADLLLAFTKLLSTVQDLICGWCFLNFGHDTDENNKREACYTIWLSKKSFMWRLLYLQVKSCMEFVRPSTFPKLNVVINVDIKYENQIIYCCSYPRSIIDPTLSFSFLLMDIDCYQSD